MAGDGSSASRVLLWAGSTGSRGTGLATQAASENETGRRAARATRRRSIAVQRTGRSGPCARRARRRADRAADGARHGRSCRSSCRRRSAALLVEAASRRSGITTVAAFGIAWAQIWLFNVWTLPGVQNAAPFALVILVMVVRGPGAARQGCGLRGPSPFAPVRRDPLAAHRHLRCGGDRDAPHVRPVVAARAHAPPSRLRSSPCRWWS